MSNLRFVVRAVVQLLAVTFWFLLGLLFNKCESIFLAYCILLLISSLEDSKAAVNGYAFLFPSLFV